VVYDQNSSVEIIMMMIVVSGKNLEVSEIDPEVLLEKLKVLEV
jgi:hypothetical protein